MANRVVLHVGTMKSATTYLQHVWDLNRDALGARDILWPGSGLNFAAFADRLAQEKHKRPADGDWPTLVTQVAGHRGTALLSNELLSLRRKGKLARLVDECDWPLEVVITARDLGRVIPSQWVTGALNRQPTPWPEFIAELLDDNRDHPAVAWFWRRQDLPAIIKTWAGLVGTGSVTLVTVPKPGAATTVVLERFMEVLGVDATDLLQPPAEAAIGPATAEFARRLGVALHDIPRDEWVRVVAALTPRSGIDPAEEKVWLSSRQLSWAAEHATRIVGEVVRLGVRVIGDVEDLIPVADQPWVEPTPPPTDAELARVAVRSMTRLIRGDNRPPPMVGSAGTAARS